MAIGWEGGRGVLSVCVCVCLGVWGVGDRHSRFGLVVAHLNILPCIVLEAAAP